MKKILKIILVGSLVLLCFSCYYDTLIEATIPDDQVVSFENDIQPIFTTNCASCHNSVIANPDLRAGMSFDALIPEYVSAFDSDNSELVNALPGNNHPVDAGFSLSTIDIALIKAWIDQGAEDN